ncbi:hypothetical protein Tco_1539936 [Tanacetum coccineum]
MRYSRPRSSHCLLLPHPLQIHQDMFLNLQLDYPADREDDDDDDNEDEDEDEEEEEEHPASADSVPPVHRATMRIATDHPIRGQSRVTNLATLIAGDYQHREREAKMARKAWGLSMDASDYARSEVMSLRTTVHYTDIEVVERTTDTDKSSYKSSMTTKSLAQPDAPGKGSDIPKNRTKVEKYVGGLPDTIHGSVMATKPKTMQDAIEFRH